MVSRWWVVIGAVLLALAGQHSAHAAAPDVVVDWDVRQAGSQTSILATVTNDGAAELSHWHVAIGFPHLVTDVSGAISVQDDNQLTLTSQTPLAPGESADVVLTVAPLGSAPFDAQWCSTHDGDCTLTASTSGAPTEQRTGPIEPDGAPALEVSYRVDEDWGTGQSIVMSVTNRGPAATGSWRLSVPASVQVASMWDADSLSGGGTIRATNEPWNGYLAPGDTIEFGFVAMPGDNQEWRACEAQVDGAPASCRISAADSWLGYPELPSQW